ncbi:MAG: hypothetical protein QW292_07000 [Candidatus Parvarchaeota archaeon]
MRILEVEPDYYTKYPPLGLLKLGKLEERRWNEVRLVRGTERDLDFVPQKILITSLFTFAWKPVHNAIDFYHNKFPRADIIVGGIYATLMPENIRKSFPFVKIHSGLVEEAEGILPAYHLLKQVDKWKDWKKSIVFTTRGCIRKCPFCVVPKIEGGMKEPKFSILPLIHPSHNEVVIWDNNFLASPYAKDILIELRDGGYKVDFNQGLDARLMTEEFAGLLADIKSPSIHMAYDWPWEGPYVVKAIDLLASAGYRRRDLIFYVLYNFYDFKYSKGDTPEDFFHRIRDLMEWGASAYPMRFIPLNSLTRNGFVSPLWTAEQLEMIADARRVLGYAGTFVPYRGFVDKILNACSFEEAMQLRPKKGIKNEKSIIGKNMTSFFTISEDNSTR